MSQAPILFFGRNPAIMALVKQQISSLGHQVEGYLDETEVSARLRSGPVLRLILGTGVEPRARMNCRALTTELGVLLLEHEGGLGTLSRNVAAVLAERRS